MAYVLNYERILKGLKALDKAMHKNQCYACSHEFIDVVNEFGTDIIYEALALLEEQEAEIRQLRLALDIAKGTCKGIKSGGGQFADMPTMQSAT